MADIVTSAVRGAGKTAKDAAKGAVGVLTAPAKAMLSFYKQIPILGKMMDNTVKEYKKTNDRLNKTVMTNTKSIDSLSKNIHRLGVNAGQSAHKSLHNDRFGDMKKVALGGGVTGLGGATTPAIMIGLVAAAMSNKTIRESAIGALEGTTLGALQLVLGKEKAEALRGQVEDVGSVVVEKIAKFGDNMNDIITVLKPLGTIFKGLSDVSKYLWEKLGGKEDNNIAGVVGAFLLTRVGIAAITSIAVGAMRGIGFLAAAKMASGGRGIGLGLGQVINAQTVIVNGANVVGGRGGAAGAGGKGGKSIFSKSRLGLGGKAAILGLSAAALYSGYNWLSGDNGDEGPDGTGAPGSKVGAGIQAAGLATALAGPTLVEMWANKKIQNAPDGEPLSTKGIKNKRKLARIKAHNAKLEAASMSNTSVQGMAKKMVKLFRRGGGVVVVAVEGYGYFSNRMELTKKYEEGQMPAELYEEALTKLNFETAGRLTGGLAGAAAGAAIGSVVPIAGTIVGGVVGGIVGSMVGESLGTAAAAAVSRPSVSSSNRLSSTASKKKKKYPHDRAKYCMDYFMKAGMSRDDAAAMVSNLIAESGLDTNAVGDNGAAYGIAQWNDRQPALRRWAAERGRDVSDLDTQLDFIIWELNNSEKGAWSRIQDAQGAEAKAVAVDRFYERSAKGARGETDSIRKTTAVALAGGDTSMSLASGMTYNQGAHNNLGDEALPSWAKALIGAVLLTAPPAPLKVSPGNSKGQSSSMQNIYDIPDAVSTRPTIFKVREMQTADAY